MLLSRFALYYRLTAAHDCKGAAMRTLTGGEGLVESSPVSIQFPVLAENSFGEEFHNIPRRLGNGVVYRYGAAKILLKANIIRERTP